MNFHKKKKLKDAVKSLETAIYEIKKRVISDEKLSVNDLADCQELAIALGEVLEARSENTDEMVGLLEKYCEYLYMLSEKECGDTESISIVYKIENCVTKLSIMIERYIPDDKKEVVFLPYKSSMWDSMESVWKAAIKDENVNVIVMPIPYFDKKADGTPSEWHYEGNDFPDYVEITNYKSYSIEENHPDVVIIHNPYDEYNRVTSVHPVYYSVRLKKCTDCLIYIPYYVVSVKEEEHFVTTPGVANSHFMFVQNDEIREFYINTLLKYINIDRGLLERKIIALGTPKADKIVNSSINDYSVPDEWKEIISGKKVVFFNTNLALLLRKPNGVIKNIERIFDTVRRKEEFTIIWREHPLSLSTIDSMVPEIRPQYDLLKKKFIEEKWGIFDTTPDSSMAMALSDCYFGAGGSLAELYAISGKPIMIMDYRYPEQISEKPVTAQDIIDNSPDGVLYVERNLNSLEIFLQELDFLMKLKNDRIKLQSKMIKNLDGTIGDEIYRFIVKNVLKR